MSHSRGKMNLYVARFLIYGWCLSSEMHSIRLRFFVRSCSCSFCRRNRWWRHVGTHLQNYMPYFNLFLISLSLCVFPLHFWRVFRNGAVVMSGPYGPYSTLIASNCLLHSPDSLLCHMMAGQGYMTYTIESEHPEPDKRCIWTFSISSISRERARAHIGWHKISKIK